MSNKLYKLGAFAFKHKWLMLLSWIVVLATVGYLMVTYQKPASDSFNIPGTEAQIAIDKLEKSLPEASGGSGRIVFATPQDKTVIEYQAAITKSLEQVAKAKDVALVYSPFQTGAISPDGHIAYAQVQLKVPGGEVTPETSEEVAKALTTVRATDLQAEIGGDIVSQAPGEILGIGEIAGLVVAILVLIMTFGSLLMAGMPLLIALFSVGIGASGIYAASSLIEINSTTPVLAIMLGLAVGIDYALFIITRHRSYMLQGLEPAQAAARAISTAGNAVVFAALTVVIALSALTLVGIPFMASMGVAAAATVAVAGLIAISLTPALLGFAGKRALSRRQRKQMLAEQHPDEVKRSFSLKWVSGVTKHPLITLFFSLALLVTVALPAASLQLGFPSAANESVDKTERRAYDLLSKGFGAGFNGPLVVVADFPAGLSEQQSKASIGEIQKNLAATKNVAVAQVGGASSDGRTVIFQVIPKTGPTDSATKDLINDVRSDTTLAGDDITLAVTGSTALSADIDKKLAGALPKYLGVVIGLSLILLIIVFRSVLVPLKATLGFLLTIAATFGALVALFQWEWFGLFEYSPVISFLPVLIIGILFGLAMDYEFFLVSGMHEAYQHNGQQARRAVIDGFTHGSKVVTAAAIIMISVFSGFVLNHDTMICMIGFALAFGVLIDAFIVRMTIVPAVMALFGKAAWWIPGWLSKIIPNVSIEGDDETFSKNLAPEPTGILEAAPAAEPPITVATPPTKKSVKQLPDLKTAPLVTAPKAKAAKKTGKKTTKVVKKAPKKRKK